MVKKKKKKIIIKDWVLFEELRVQKGMEKYSGS